MLLPFTGTIYNSMKIAQLNMKWQQRKDNPNLMQKQDEDPQIRMLKKSAENVRKSNIISAIDGKLKAGGELSDDELAYLKAHNPQLYQEAMEIRQERAAYKKALENCETKEDVERLNSNRIQSALSQVNSIRGNPNIPQGAKVGLMEKIMRRMMGIQSEHQKFIRTKEYADLPREEDLKEEEAKRKNKDSAVSEETELQNPEEKPSEELEELRKELADPSNQEQPEPDTQEPEKTPETGKSAPSTKDSSSAKVTVKTSEPAAKGQKGSASAKEPVQPAIHSTTAVKSTPVTTFKTAKINIKV